MQKLWDYLIIACYFITLISSHQRTSIKSNSQHSRCFDLFSYPRVCCDTAEQIKEKSVRQERKNRERIGKNVRKERVPWRGKESEEKIKTAKRNARRIRKWRSVPRDTRGDCFGRAPISTVLWAVGGICGDPYIAAQRAPALLPRGSRPWVAISYRPRRRAHRLSHFSFSLFHSLLRDCSYFPKFRRESSPGCAAATDRRRQPRAFPPQALSQLFPDVRAWYNGYTVLCIDAEIDASRYRSSYFSSKLKPSFSSVNRRGRTLWQGGSTSAKNNTFPSGACLPFSFFFDGH